MDELGLGEMEELETGLLVIENFLIGDTIDLMNVDAHIREYRNSKGFLIKNEKWNGNESFIIIDRKGESHLHHVGKSYFSMKICTCRMILLEKNQYIF